MAVKGKRARRRSIVQAAEARLLHLTDHQIGLAVRCGIGDAAHAIREGNQLPESALRQPASAHRKALEALLPGRVGAEGIVHERRHDDVVFQASALVPLHLGADARRIAADELQAWDAEIGRTLDARLDVLADAVRQAWEALGAGTPHGIVAGRWPLSEAAAAGAAAELAKAAVASRERARRLDALGFSDLRMLHRTQPLPPRRIVALLGPTNSGKTHEGLGMLAAADTGAYLAPLRLLAMENQEALGTRGVVCDLVTGEETIVSPGATHVSSTIEMLDIGRRYDVVLVDEIQMLADRTRGWAWTRALLSADAPLIVVAGSEDALPLIRRIARITGDEVEVRHFERRGDLVVAEHPIAIDDLRPGDAVIAFTRADVLAWKQEIDERRMTSAVIYGALGPDVRRSEAARFRSGEAEVIVATDAIGMGLNLPIRRVLFTTSTKYDGRQRAPLLPSAIRQIAGRAGRYGHHDEGVVGVVEGCNGRPGWLRHGLDEPTRLPKRVRIAPTWEGVRRILEEDRDQTLIEVLTRIREAVNDHPLLDYWVDDDDMTLLSMAHAAGLSPQDQFRHLGLPLPMRSPDNRTLLRMWLGAASRGVAPHVPADATRGESDDVVLQRLETLAVQCGAYAWLARRFPDTYVNGAEALARRDAASERLSRLLAQRGSRRAGRHRFRVTSTTREAAA